MNELAVQIQNEIKKVIIGKDDVIEKVLTAILAQGHILMEDVPGVGKTTMAMAFSKVLGLDNKRVQTLHNHLSKPNSTTRDTISTS